MISTGRRALAGIIATALVLSAAGFAEGASTNLGSFKKWTAWKGTDAYGDICFISAQPDTMEPKESNGKPVNRDPANFLVIHREKAPSINSDGTAATDKSGKPVFKKVRNEVQVLIGYPLKVTTDTFFHTVEIDGKSYNMKSIADDKSTAMNDSMAAWLANTDTEAGFVTAMKSGTKLVVHGTSARSGLKTTDTYALAGVTAAMAAIDKACP